MSTTYYKDSKEYTYREALALTGANFKEVDKNIAVFIREGFKVVMPTPKPTPTTDLKRVIRNGVEIDTNGNTVQAWVEVDMFTTDLLDEDDVTILKTIAEQESEYLAKLEADVIATKNSLVETTVQTMLDSAAKEARYDSIMSACSYVGSTNFGVEAQSFLDWRDAVWTYVFTVQSQILAGTRTEPTLDELMLELPTRV